MIWTRKQLDSQTTLQKCINFELADVALISGAYWSQQPYEDGEGQEDSVTDQEW